MIVVLLGGAEMPRTEFVVQVVVTVEQSEIRVTKKAVREAVLAALDYLPSDMGARVRRVDQAD